MRRHDPKDEVNGQSYSQIAEALNNMYFLHNNRCRTRRSVESFFQQSDIVTRVIKIPRSVSSGLTNEDIVNIITTGKRPVQYRREAGTKKAETARPLQTIPAAQARAP